MILLRAMAYYDVWCLVVVAKLMCWMEEWLSVSQKTAERAMIVLYLLLLNATAPPKFLAARVMSYLSLGLMMWTMHSLFPRRIRLSLGHCAARGIAQAVLMVPVTLSPHHWRDLLLVLAQIIYVVFWYSTSFYSSGTRGRRRKEATERWKKWLGTLDWLPRPAEGQA